MINERKITNDKTQRKPGGSLILSKLSQNDAKSTSLLCPVFLCKVGEMQVQVLEFEPIIPVPHPVFLSFIYMRSKKKLVIQLKTSFFIYRVKLLCTIYFLLNIT